MEVNQTAFSLIWEAEAVAHELNITPRRAYYLLSSGKLPGKKVGGRWVVEREQLRAFFRGDARSD